MTIDYKNSKVYKIWSPNGDKIYVGSTTKKLLCQRMTAHREDFKRWKDGKFQSVSSSSRSKIIWYNIRINSSKSSSSDEKSWL